MTTAHLPTADRWAYSARIAANSRRTGYDDHAETGTNRGEEMYVRIKVSTSTRGEVEIELADNELAEISSPVNLSSVEQLIDRAATATKAALRADEHDEPF